MLLNAVARVARPFAARRPFVSAVLLTRTWQNETVSVLRSEARLRGLSPKGNKANLIVRIQQHDSTPTPARHASLAATPPHDGEGEGETPGIPPAQEHHSQPPPELVFNVHIPDLSQPIPEQPIQIPYLPDFWDSSALVSKPEPPKHEELLPKMVVIGGAGTHPFGSPSHNLLDANEPASSGDVSRETEPPRAPGQGGLWDDIAEDLGIPPTKQVKSAFWKLFS